jgi:radical SAM superfamily enzyme YgiQ (UPF0313 family)
MITFIHVASKSAIATGPDHEIPILPVGMIALANHLKRNGFSSEILHLATETKIANNFDIVKYITRNNRKLLCFDLHWHFQSRSVIDTVIEIKKQIPLCHIILGGFTASIYAEEILETFEQVDFIIKGDAEVPLLRLVKTIISEEKNFSEIPNLVWRLNDNLISNEQTYTVTPNIIDSLNFGDCRIIKHFEKYYEYFSSKCLFNECCEKVFFYVCGRGCPVNCSYCGGSKISQQLINRRGKIIWISIPSIIREIRTSITQGFRNYWICFDPLPESNYYINLFESIKKEKLEIGMIFECWALPTKQFIEAFASTFNPERSRIIVSPDTGSDEVRKKNKGYYYSNQDLIEILKHLNQRGVHVQLCFTAGLPFEKKGDIEKTVQLIKFIKKNFPKIAIAAAPIASEPGAPWLLDKQRYGLKSSLNSFMDFYLQHKAGIFPEETEYLTAKEIKKAIRRYNSEAGALSHPK